MKKFFATILLVTLLLTTMPLAFAGSDTTYEVGDIVEFGSYPQTEVTDEALVAELNALAPSWDSWTSYGYYSGTESIGTMTQGDWMRYTDVTYNGSKYRGVKFTQYRPYYTYYQSSSSYTHQSTNGYSTNTVYWFKFEPIEWRVLDPATGLVMCETIIDSQPYSNTIYSNGGGTYGYFNDASYTNYASDYETSSIRQWLNNDFYNTAFTDSEKNEINTTTLNNDGYFTSVGTSGYEALDSNSTNDKIFLLSYNESINSNFGFSSDYSDYDTARQAQGSDYAKSQGLWVYTGSSNSYYGNSHWLLRSPGYGSNYGCDVGYNGLIFSVDLTGIGVRPALRFNLNSEIVNPEHTHSYSSVITKQPTHLELGEITYTCECGSSYTEETAKLEDHTYKAAITAPTCTENGYTTYTCECGDTYTETIEATGHNFDGSKCTVCGFDKADDCSCNCHKTGIMSLVWKIINFFNKLFRKNETCACGVEHW